MVLFWILLFVVLILVEIVTLGLTTIWFAGGALISIVAALLGLPIWLQILLFTATSIALLFFTRPLALKYFDKSHSHTNADRAIGEQAIVTKEINNVLGAGQVTIKGLEWTARNVDADVIEEGTIVTVMAIEGVKVIVKR